MGKTAEQMVAEANAVVDGIGLDEAKALYGREDVAWIDIRDIRELQRDGKIPGATHAPRGMLEFWICEGSPYHRPLFAENKTYLFYCAGGLRSALAAKTAQDMGLAKVKHLLGGYGAWKTAGEPTEEVVPKA